MEIFYAWERGKDVLIVSDDKISPWVSYHSKVQFSGVQEAMSYLVEYYSDNE